MYRGFHLLSHWSRTQTTVALSSGEAELNASLKRGVELLGIKELLQEMGEDDVRLTLEGDSAACRGTVHREGSGRLKHLQVRQLWIQSHIKDGRLNFTKIPRALNTADAMTKHWSSEGRRHFAAMNADLCV